MPDDTACLILIRHGATEANVVRPYRLQGRGSDFPLCELGVKQAEAARDFLAARCLERVYSSPLKRALQTANLLAEPHRAAVETVEALTECDVGRWEGRDWETIRAGAPAHYERFLANPYVCGYLGGESFADVRARVVPCFEELLDRAAGKTIAVVSHHVVNRVYLAHLLGVAEGRARNIRQDNGGISVIRRRGGQTRVITLNITDHLNGLETPE